MGKVRFEMSIELLEDLLKIPYKIINVKESDGRKFEIIIEGCDLPQITNGKIPLGQMILSRIEAKWEEIKNG